MYKLIIEDDEGKTTVVPLIRDEITIGRKEGNTIRLTERNVSRRHAKLSKANGTIYIEDLQSYNGIRVNGDRIAGRAPITEGDRVQIGDYQLALKLDKSAVATTPPVGEDDGGSDKTTPFIKQDDRAPADAPTRASPIINASAGAPTAASQTIAGPAESPAERPARLVVVSSNFAGKEFRLDKAQCVIGRTDENDVVINHRSISRHHAKIVRENGRYQVVDLGSANGVRVNGEDYGKVELRKGDLIDLGHVRLRFVAPNEDFVFARDAQVVDVAGTSEKKSPVKLIVAVVALLLVVGGVAVVAMSKSGGGGDAPKGEAASASRIAEINLEVDKAIAAADWDGAIAKATEGLGLDSGNAMLRDKRTKAESEKKAQAIYDQYTKAAKAGDNEAAVMRFLEVPENSVYHDKAQETWPVIKGQYIRDHSDKARALLAANNCGEAKKHVEAVLMVDDANAAVIEIATKCGQPTPAPKKPSGAPRPVKPAGTEKVAASKPEKVEPAATPTPPKPTPPEPTPPPPAAKSSSAVAEANEAYVKGDYRTAVEKAREALKENPNDTKAWRMYGGASCFLKDVNAARVAWNHLGSIERRFLVFVCSKNQITLP